MGLVVCFKLPKHKKPWKFTDFIRFPHSPSFFDCPSCVKVGRNGENSLETEKHWALPRSPAHGVPPNRWYLAIPGNHSKHRRQQFFNKPTRWWCECLCSNPPKLLLCCECIWWNFLLKDCRNIVVTRTRQVADVSHNMFSFHSVGRKHYNISTNF